MKKMMMAGTLAVTGVVMAAAVREDAAVAVQPSPAACVRTCPDGKASAKRLWDGISPVVREWELAKREETLDWFRRHQFGVTPIGRPADMKIGERSVTFADGRIKIDIHLSLPPGASKERPAPVFLFGDHRNNKTKEDPFAPTEYEGIPTNSITARGYAYVRWNFNNVCPNAALYSKDLEWWARGVIAWNGTGDPMSTNVVRTAESWGTIGAWAWGNSRVMDWIESRPELDAKRVAVLGHSRGGKTALWTGAQDERFAMTISSGSGCGGAKLNRFDLEKSERIGQILRNFPNWFCLNYREWVDRDSEITHDSDELLKLIAPRLLYVASGSADDWAGPAAEKAATDSARKLWEAYKLPERVGYHCHEGPHKLRADDWEKFMDFADKYLKAPSTADTASSVFSSATASRCITSKSMCEVKHVFTSFSSGGICDRMAANFR